MRPGAGCMEATVDGVGTGAEGTAARAGPGKDAGKLTEHPRKLQVRLGREGNHSSTKPWREENSSGREIYHIWEGNAWISFRSESGE
jgi:hypothetical protein